MIKLINNEFKKIGKYKIFLSQLLFLLVIYIIKKSNNSMEEYLFGMIPFIGIVCFIFFGGIISSERENGTLRFYLTKPYKRWKIYLSKLLCIIIYLLIIIIFILIVYFIINGKFDKVFLLKYLKYCTPLFLMSSIVLLLSNIFKSTSIVVGLSIFILSFGLLISQLFLDANLNFIQYTFLPYLDYSIFNDKNIIYEFNQFYSIKLTMSRAIIMDIIYMILFYVIGTIYFNKKDIKN